MHNSQNARIMYIVKNGNQQSMNPPTIKANVLAALVSMRKRFACTRNMRRPTPLIVLLPSPAFASDWLVSLDALLSHKNDSMFSLRFSVICIICRIGLLLVIVISFGHSAFISSVRDLTKHSRRRSNDVVPILFDGFKWCPVNGGDIRGTLFDRLPRCMRNVKRVSSKRFCFDEPAIIQCQNKKIIPSWQNQMKCEMKWNEILIKIKIQLKSHNECSNWDATKIDCESDNEKKNKNKTNRDKKKIGSNGISHTHIMKMKTHTTKKKRRWQQLMNATYQTTWTQQKLNKMENNGKYVSSLIEWEERERRNTVWDTVNKGTKHTEYIFYTELVGSTKSDGVTLVRTVWFEFKIWSIKIKRMDRER